MLRSSMSMLAIENGICEELNVKEITFYFVNLESVRLNFGIKISYYLNRSFLFSYHCFRNRYSFR